MASQLSSNSKASAEPENSSDIGVSSVNPGGSNEAVNPGRKNTSFKITNILPSRPPSHDPEESGDDDPDDSHTEDLSEHFEHAFNANIAARGRFNILPCHQDEQQQPKSHSGQSTTQNAYQHGSVSHLSGVTNAYVHHQPNQQLQQNQQASVAALASNNPLLLGSIPVQPQPSAVPPATQWQNQQPVAGAVGGQVLPQQSVLPTSIPVGVSANVSVVSGSGALTASGSMPAQPGSVGNTTITATAGVTAQLPNANRYCITFF